MNLELSSELLGKSMVTPHEARLCLAVQLYADRRLCFEEACELAQVVPAAFKRELINRDISVVIYPQITSWSKQVAG